MGTIIFYPVTLTLEFDLLFKNFNLANNFWTVSTRALIFHMSIPCDKTFPWIPLFFFPVTLTLEFDLLFKNFNLANNFWIVSARALIFHMSIPCYKTFQWVPLFFTLLPWPWSLTYFFKTLTLLITFDELWVLELWYFTWVVLVIRPIRWYNNFLPCDLDLTVLQCTYFLKILILLITFE